MAKKTARHSSGNRPRGKSAIVQHVESLKALDRQFDKFEKRMRSAIQHNEVLKPLEAELNRTLAAVMIPAYGFRRKRR